MSSPILTSLSVDDFWQLKNPLASPRGSLLVNLRDSPRDNPLANPRDSPLDNPRDSLLASPLANPLASPLASPLANPRNSQTRNRQGNRRGSPVISPRCSPLGNLRDRQTEGLCRNLLDCPLASRQAARPDSLPTSPLRRPLKRLSLRFPSESIFSLARVPRSPFLFLGFSKRRCFRRRSFASPPMWWDLRQKWSLC